MQNFEETIALNADVVREINKKCEKRIENMRAQKSDTTAHTITKIKDVEAGTLFASDTFWQVVNLETLMEFEIPGTSVAFYLTGKEAIREMLERGEIEAFEHKNFYIKFKCAKSASYPNNNPAAPKRRQKSH